MEESMLTLQALQKKAAIAKSARNLLKDAVDAECYGKSLKALSSFIEELDEEIARLEFKEYLGSPVQLHDAKSNPAKPSLYVTT